MLLFCLFLFVVFVNFVFGDFFVDIGNNNFFVLFLVKVNFYLNGIDFGNGVLMGRFCNGCIVFDIICMCFFNFFI